jgi:hypothetical protein
MMFDFKILFAIIFIIISDEIFQLSHVIFIIQFLYYSVPKYESSFFADTCTRPVPIFYIYNVSRYIKAAFTLPRL